MVSFLLRSPRIEFELVMSIGLQDSRSGIPLPGQLAATVINFSARGACLIVPKLALNGRHVFYDTLNRDQYNLLLYLGGLESENEISTIAARSIWMNSCEQELQPAFKIGIQFLLNQNRLYKLLRKSYSPQS
jgi:hypothetical protein